MLLVLLLLPCLSWAAVKNCFDRVRNHTLLGTVVVTLDNISLQQCQHACLEAKKQSCRSLMFQSSKKRCFLNSEDMKTRESQFIAVLDPVDYYHRTCYYKPGETVKRDSSFEDKCYEVIKGKVLIGIVDQLIQDITTLEECKRRCQKSKEVSDIICKSAIFYEKEKECIIASQSRSDMPDLFIEDDQAVYIENTCLSKGGSTIKMLQKIGETVPEISTPEIPTTTQETKVEHLETSFSSETAAETISTSGKAEELSKKTHPNHVELSGYETPADTVSHDSQTEEFKISSTTTTTEKPTTSFDAKVIDSYNVEPVVKTAAVETKSSAAVAGYGRRLRDARVKDCFTEVRPLRPMDQTRITKAYSLEQCTDICRLCWRCLHNKKCEAVAFDASRELCALSTTHIIEGGSMQNVDGIVYHNRHDC